MRTGVAVVLAALLGTTGVGVGFLLGVTASTASTAADSPPRAADYAPEAPRPLPDQAVIYDGKRMTFAEAERAHAASASALPKGWTLHPLPNPNEWVTYRGLRMTWAQLWEAAHCEQRLAAAEASAPAVMIAAPDFEEFQRKQAARTAAMERAELMRQAVRDELQRQELVRPVGAR